VFGIILTMLQKKEKPYKNKAFQLSQRELNYFLAVSAAAVSAATESTAKVSTAEESTITAEESTAPSSEGLLVQEAKATIPATNASANIFFILWV
jgi:hypothetical protein